MTEEKRKTEGGRLEAEEKPKNTYSVFVDCMNCGGAFPLVIKKGISVNDAKRGKICPICGCKAQFIREGLPLPRYSEPLPKPKSPTDAEEWDAGELATEFDDVLEQKDKPDEVAPPKPKPSPILIIREHKDNPDKH